MSGTEPPGTKLSGLVFLGAAAACAVAATSVWLSLGKIRKRRVP